MKKLAIVCGSPASEMLAPFDDEDYEIWVLGNRCQNYPRFDLIFEIHDETEEEHDIRYPQWLVDKNIPLIVGKSFSIEADHVTVFPFDESEELFGSRYLTSSPAMMLCLAMLRGYQDIILYGVDLAIDDFEYFWQRPCMEAWIGFARGKGLNVTLHESSPVFRADYVEGEACGGKPDFSKPPFTEAGFLALASRHQDKVSDAQKQIEVLQVSIQTNDGARQAYTHLARTARSVEAGNDIQSLEHTVRQR
jgi:hypothetical protein